MNTAAAQVCGAAAARTTIGATTFGRLRGLALADFGELSRPQQGTAAYGGIAADHRDQAFENLDPGQHARGARP